MQPTNVKLTLPPVQLIATYLPLAALQLYKTFLAYIKVTGLPL